MASHRRTHPRPAARRAHHPRLARPRRGLGARRVRQDPGAVRGVGDRGRAALAQGQRAGLGDRGVRDAAALDQHPLRPRVGQGPDRRPHPRDLPAGRPLAARVRSTTRRSARTRSCSTATCCRPTAAPAPPRSPARTSRWPTRSSWLRAQGRAGGRAARRPRWPRCRSASSTAARCSTSATRRTSRAETDMNVVMTGDGRVRRGAGHGRGRRRSTAALLDELLDLAAAGCADADRGCSRPALDGVTARLVLATRNAHKLDELRRILADGGRRRASSADALPDGAPDVVEDGLTFADNALLKARVGGGAHRAAGRRRRLRAVRRRAERDARRASRPAGPAGTATTRPTWSWCSPRSPTCRTSTSARAFVVRGGAGAAVGARSGWSRARCDGRAGRARRGGPTGSATTRSSSRTATSVTTAEMTAEEKDAITHRGRGVPRPGAGAARAARLRLRRRRAWARRPVAL